MVSHSFQARLRTHLGQWADAHGFDERHLEVRRGVRSLVLRREHRPRNLYREGWWTWLDGKAHRWAGALNSSQCFAVNLFGPLVEDTALATAVVRRLLGPERVPSNVVASCCVEFTPRETRVLLGERGQPTQVDAAFEIRCGDGAPALWFIEVKLAEAEFGSCRGARLRGGPNPEPARCRDLPAVLRAPETHCWLAEAEGRRYWQWVLSSDGSFEESALRGEQSCPFRHGLYQLMRNRALGDALVAAGAASWAEFSTCIHPQNRSARQLPGTVAGSGDVIKAFQGMTRPGALTELAPASVLAAVVQESPALMGWAEWMRSKYLLDGATVVR